VPDEPPVAAHLYGAAPEVMAEAARLVEPLGRFAAIDINAGCPVRKIVAKGAGAALMGDPERLRAIVAAVRQAVSLPVTVKTRIGLRPDRNNALDVARAAQDGGAAALAVHARFASQHHRGDARWDVLAAVKQALDIPVIGNGGIDTAEDAPAMFRQTGVDGVMVGRAAIGNPWIFRQIDEALAGRPPSMPSPRERRAAIVEQLDRLVALKTLERRYRRRGSMDPDQAAALHFRGHLYKYLAGLPGWAAVRRRLNELASVRAVLEASDEVLDAAR
jgi:nifR3 family TIM-barrel protein